MITGIASLPSAPLQDQSRYEPVSSTVAIESPPITGTHTANASPSSRTGRVQWKDEESESYSTYIRGYQRNLDSLDEHMKGGEVARGREGEGAGMQRSQTRPDTMDLLDQAMYKTDISLAPPPGYGIKDNNLYPNKEYVSPFEPKFYQAYRWPNRPEYISLKQAGLYEVYVVLYVSIVCTYIYEI